MLQKLSKAISRKDVKVVFAGKQAKTDGNKITLPAFTDATLRANPGLKAALHGYCDHEVAHVRHTDFPALIKNEYIIPGQGSFKIFNTIEDLRIEKKSIIEYPGMKKNLQNVVDHLYNTVEFKTDHPLHWLFVEGRKGYGIIFPEGENYQSDAKSIYGPDIFDKISALEDTQDAMNLTIEILKKNGEKKDRANDEKGESGNDAGNESGNDAGNESGNDAGNESGNDESGNDDIGDSKQGDSDGIGEKDVKGDDEDGDQETFGEEDMVDHKSLSDMMKDEIESGTSSEEYMPMSTELDEIIKMEATGGVWEYEHVKKGLGKLNTAKRKIAKAFQVKIASKWVGGQDSGKVNTRALAGVKTGNRQVFKRKITSTEVDTAVTLLLDYSGSMTWGRLDIAKQATILFMEAFELAGIKTEVLGYTTSMDCPDVDGGQWNHDHGSHVPYGRTEGLITYVIKEFNEKITSDVKKRLFVKVDCNNNADGESVVIAHNRLTKQKQKRKILFVLTDGRVECYGNNKVGAKYLKKVVKEIEKAGNVEIIGVDLEAGEAGKSYSKVIDVPDKDNLTSAILKGVSDILGVRV